MSAGAGVHSTRSFVASQASHLSPSDDFICDSSEGREDIVMTIKEGLSSSSRAGDAVKYVYAPGDSESQQSVNLRLRTYTSSYLYKCESILAVLTNVLQYHSLLT